MLAAKKKQQLQKRHENFLRPSSNLTFWTSSSGQRSLSTRRDSSHMTVVGVASWDWVKTEEVGHASSEVFVKSALLHSSDPFATVKLLLGARQKARGSTKRPGKWPIRRLALSTTFRLSQQLLLTPQPRFNLGLLAYWTTVSLEGAPVTQVSCCQCVDLWSSCCKLPNLFNRAKIIVWISVELGWL